MKRGLFILATAVLSGFGVSAQEAYAPVKQGTVLMYVRTEAERWTEKNSNAETFSGTTFRHTVKKVADGNGNISVAYLDETVEPARRREKVLLSEEVVSETRDGCFYVDLRDITWRERQQLAESNAAGVTTGGSTATSGAPRNGFSASVRMPAVRIVDFGKDVYEYGEIGIPLNAASGDTIPETTLRLERRAIVNTHCDVRTFNWRVEAVDEEVTVGAGTFKCIRLTCDVTYHFRGIARLASLTLGEAKPSPHTFWYAKGVGLVKMEAMKAKDTGALDKTIELAEIGNMQ